MSSFIWFQIFYGGNNRHEDMMNQQSLLGWAKEFYAKLLINNTFGVVGLWLVAEHYMSTRDYA